MTDRTPPRLELPYAALHAPTNRGPHVDSEEAVRYERRRVSRELEPFHTHNTSRPDSTAPSPSLRSRNGSTREPHASHEQLRRHTSIRSDAGTQPDVPDTTEHDGRSTTASTRSRHWYTPLTTFWSTHITLTIDEGAHRDHLALERTFLGYLRTSLILVMTGVLTAQLYRLQHAANPNPSLGFYVIGRPLSILFMGMAIVVVCIGAFRFWKLQNGLVRGKAMTGGWEVLVVMGLSMLLLIVTFALVLGVNIEKALDRS